MPENRGSGRMIGIIIICVLLAAALAVGVYFVIKAIKDKNGGQDPSAAVNSPAPTEAPADETAKPTEAPSAEPILSPTEVPPGVYDDTRWAIVSTVTYDENGVPSEEKKSTVTVSGKHVVTSDPEEADIEHMFSVGTDPATNGLYFLPKHDGEWFQVFYDTEKQKEGLRKFNGEELIWKKYYGMTFSNLKEYGEYLVMSGWREDGQSGGELIMMGRDGEIIWRKAYYGDKRRCFPFDILFEEDGCIAVFGRSVSSENTSNNRFDTFFFRRYSPSGELITATESAQDTELIGYFCGVEPMGDGFVIGLRHWSYETSDIKWDVTTLDHDGRLLRTFDFSKLVDETGERTVLGIDYASYHDGLLYVSGYTARTENGRENYYLDRIALKKTEYGRYAYEALSREELGILARKLYSAVLFAIDPETGEIKSIITVEGGIGMETYENENGELVWNVLDIFIFSFGYDSSVTPNHLAGLKTAYTFDETGGIALVARTDEGDWMYR